MSFSVPVFNLNQTDRVIPDIPELCDGKITGEGWYLDELKDILNKRLPCAVQRSLGANSLDNDYQIILIKRVRETRGSGDILLVRIDVLLEGGNKQNSYYFKINEPKSEGDNDMENMLAEIIACGKSFGLDSIPLLTLEKAANGDEVGAVDDIEYRSKMFNIVRSMIEYKKFELARMIVGELRLRFGQEDSEVNMLDFMVNFFERVEPFGKFDVCEADDEQDDN